MQDKDKRGAHKPAPTSSSLPEDTNQISQPASPRNQGLSEESVDGRNWEIGLHRNELHATKKHKTTGTPKQKDVYGKVRVDTGKVDNGEGKDEERNDDDDDEWQRESAMQSDDDEGRMEESGEWVSVGIGKERRMKRKETEKEKEKNDEEKHKKQKSGGSPGGLAQAGGVTHVVPKASGKEGGRRKKTVATKSLMWDSRVAEKKAETKWPPEVECSADSPRGRGRANMTGRRKYARRK